MAGPSPTGRTFRSAHFSAVFCVVRAGGACEIWQQAGTETAAMDTSPFGMSTPAQPLGASEVGIAQIGPAHRELDTSAATRSATTPNPASLVTNARLWLHEFICLP